VDSTVSRLNNGLERPSRAEGNAARGARPSDESDRNEVYVGRFAAPGGSPWHTPERQVKRKQERGPIGLLNSNPWRCTMKALPALGLLVSALVVPSLEAQLATGPDFDLLRRLAGDYVYDYSQNGQDTRGTISFRVMEGGRFAVWDEVFHPPTGQAVHIHGVVGYDELAGVYKWFRAFSNGAWDYAQGHRDGGSLVFELTDSQWAPFNNPEPPPGVKVRTVWSGIGTDEWTFWWEQSLNGGPWERTAVGRTRPAK
jgi:hypothetical protein